MAVSLVDVARRAGVSTATVSRVVSGSAYRVSAAVRERVTKAADELGYSPSAPARTLATGSSRIISVIVGDILDPYFGEIVRGVEDRARRAGYLSMVCNADRAPAVELAYLRTLREHQARGVIFAGGAFEDSREADELRKTVEQAMKGGMRVISLAERSFPMTALITVDNRAMLYDLTSYLISLGHRRIAYVEGPPSFTTNRLRREGFVRAMREAGLDPSMVQVGGFNYEAGRSAAVRMLRSLPDAIVAFNDESALGVLMALREAGVNVPGDVSVAGVDSTRDSEFVDLTTVSVPMYELGATAARRIIEDDSDFPSRTVLAHRVVPRGTTALAH